MSGTQTWTPARREEVRKALASGRTFAEIGESLGLTWQAVAQAATVYSLRPVCRKGGWTDEVVAKLKELWMSGQSASQCGKALGITRNAVIGKVTRLGLKRIIIDRAAYQRRAVAKAPPVKREPKRKPPKPVSNVSYAPTEPALEIVTRLEPGPLARPWETRTFGECAWPFGERGAILSCCEPCGDNTYCAGHMALGFRKDQNPLNRNRIKFLTTYEQRRASQRQTGPIRSWEAA